MGLAKLVTLCGLGMPELLELCVRPFDALALHCIVLGAPLQLCGQGIVGS